MAEINPVAFREVYPSRPSGGAAQLAEGAADVLGFLGGVRDNKLVKEHIEETKGIIKDINEDDPQVPTTGEVVPSDAPVLASFNQRMRKLEAKLEQGNSNQQQDARLQAKQLLERNIARHPRLRDQFIQGTSSQFSIDADYEELGVKDAYRQATSKAAQADLDDYKARGIEMGIPDSLFGTEEWNRQYVKLDFQYAQAKQYEINFLLKSQDAEASAEQVELEFNNLVVGPRAPVTLELRSVFQQLNKHKEAVRMGDAALDIEMQTGLKEQLKQRVLQVMIEAENAYHMGFGGLRQDSKAAARARSTLDQRLNYAKLVYSAIDEDDTSLLNRLELEETLKGKLMVSNDPTLGYISAVDNAIGIENLKILGELVGTENILFLDDLARALQGSLVNTAETLGVTLAHSGEYKDNPRQKTAANKAIANRNLPPATDPKARAIELAERVEEQSLTLSVLYDQSAPSFVRGTFNALSSHIALLNDDRIVTKESFNSVVELATNKKNLDNVERYRQDQSYHDDLIGLGVELGEYVNDTVYPSWPERNSRYETYLNDFITSDNYDSKSGINATYVKLRDVIELDQEALSEKRIAFKTKGTKGFKAHPKFLANDIRELTKTLNEDISLYYMSEQLKTPEEDVSYLAVLQRFGFAEILIGSPDQ